MSAKTLISRPARGQWITFAIICCPCDDVMNECTQFHLNPTYGFRDISSGLPFCQLCDGRTNRPKNYIPRNFSLAGYKNKLLRGLYHCKILF